MCLYRLSLRYSSMAKDLGNTFAKCATLTTEELVRKIAEHQLTPVDQLIYCNELIKRNVLTLPIASLKGLVSSLSDKQLKRTIWDELNWCRLIIGLLYQEAERRKIPSPEWFVILNKEQTGPHSRQQVEEIVGQQPTGNCLVWREGYPEWMSIDKWQNLTEPIQTVHCERESSVNNRVTSKRTKQPSGLSVLGGIFQFIEFPFWIALFVFALFTSYNSFTGMLLPLVFCVFMIFMSIPLGVGLMARRTWAWNLKIITALLTILWFINLFLIDGMGQFWVFAAVIEAIILTLVLLAKPSISIHE